MTQFVEIIRDSNVDKGSLLDKELNWLQEVKEFKENKLSHGHIFKTPLESAEELVRQVEEYNKYVKEELRCVWLEEIKAIMTMRSTQIGTQAIVTLMKEQM